MTYPLVYGVTYGSTGTLTADGYQLLADWSRQGLFTGTLEELSLPGLGLITKNVAVTTEWGRNEGRTTEDATAGKLTFAVNNHGKQFWTDNTSSPIAGKVLPGTTVKFSGSVAGAVTTLFAGPIVRIDDSDPRVVAFECSDGWSRPGQTRLSTAVYQGQRTGDLIRIVLDAIGWPAAARDIDPGATVVPYWWVEGTDAATAINDLVHSEGPPALAYVRAGVFVFRDRHHRLTRAASTTSQATYTHIIPAGTGPGGDFKMLRDSWTYDHGLDNIVNSANLEVTPRVPQVETVVWKTDDPISLGVNESRTFVVQADDPFVNAQAPNPLIAYLDDGTTTYDYHVAAGSITSATLSRTSGQSAYLTIVAGGSGAFLDLGIKVRATPLTAGATYRFPNEDTASVGTFGRNTWDGAVPWAGIYDADVISQRIVAVYAQARPVVTFSIAGISGTYMQEILARAVSDRVTVREDGRGINAPFVVERIAHHVRQLRNPLHTLTLTCQVIEPQQPANVFTFDTAGAGFNDGAFGTVGVDPGSMFTFDAAGKGFNDGRFAV